MTEPDLAFIRAENEKSRPLDRKSIIPLFNEYILRLCDIQNSFVSRLESSFSKLENRLDRAETLVCLLEKRLERVDLNADDQIKSEEIVPVEREKLPSTSDIQEKVEINPQPIEIVEVNENPDKSMMKIREHPVYEKYFKMLRLGIPEQAVKIKMTSEGIDPSLLSNPDKLIEAVKLEANSSDWEEKSDSD